MRHPARYASVSASRAAARRRGAGRSPAIDRPILFLLASDPAVLDALAHDIGRRFRNDCRIVAHDDPSEGLASLADLAREDEPVALLIVDQRLPDRTGVEFLERAHDLHPAAKRILLVERDYTVANPIVPAMMLGQIDYHLVKPWFPEQGLYPAVSEFLAAWAHGQEGGFSMFRIVAPEHSRRAHEIRDLLTRLAMPFAFHPEESGEARRLLDELGQDGSRLPLVLRHDGRVLLDPSDAEVVEAVGGGTELGSGVYDLVIVGAGPAGLSAAVYAASEGLETCVLEKRISGGQASASSRIRNFPGFTWGISGHDFSYRACEQAWLFGANMVFAQEVAALRAAGAERIVQLADGRTVAGRAILLTPGVSWRRLSSPRLDALIGTGVFYGAAGSEARAMRGKHVCVVGGGNSAGQAASHLAKYADRVTLLVRRNSLAATMSDYLVRELRAAPNVTARFGVEVVDGEGDGRLESITVREQASGEMERIAASALFVLIGVEPRTQWLQDAVERDAEGYVLTGADVQREAPAAWPVERQPFPFETSVPGVFAAGDVRHGSVKRVTSAVGEGSAAVQLVHQFLEEQAKAAPPADAGAPAAARIPAAATSRL